MAFLSTFKMSSADVNIMSELGERGVLLVLRLPAVFCSQRTGGLPFMWGWLFVCGVFLGFGFVISLCWHIFQGRQNQRHMYLG